jgi:uncharacterized protein (DUF1697 family)
MPTNAKMPELKVAFESAGFENVKTILGTGNIAFDTPATCETDIASLAEQAMTRTLGRSFFTIVRSSVHLQALAATDAYAIAGIPAEAKRVISFMRATVSPRVPLPLAEDHASVFLVSGCEVFSAYVRSPKGPIFMSLIERAFGSAVTTRTFDTVVKCANA